MRATQNSKRWTLVVQEKCHCGREDCPQLTAVRESREAILRAQDRLFLEPGFGEPDLEYVRAEQLKAA